MAGLPVDVGDNCLAAVVTRNAGWVVGVANETHGSWSRSQCCQGLMYNHCGSMFTAIH